MPVDLSQAVADHRRGDLERAGRGYEAALAIDPDHPVALHLSGLLALQRGDPGRAVARIGRSVALRPDNATALAHLAEAHWALGQVDRVIEYGRAALALEPDNAGVHSNLGSTLLACGEVDAALRHLREAVRLAPDLAAVRNNLGRALRIKGDDRAARDELERAVRLDPGSAESRSNLGEVLLDLGEAEAASAQCREAIRLRPGFAEARVNLGNALHTLGRAVEAAESFRAAILLKPGLAAAHAGLAGTLEELGDSPGSEAALRAAIRHDPGHAGALARLATRMHGRLPDPDRAAIERLLADPGLAPRRRWPLLFGLGHALDGRGDFDRAAPLFAEANALQREDLRRRGRGYDPEAHRRFVDRILSTFDVAFFDRLRGAGLETDRPVFIVGLPRSGTSLVEQILAGHPRVFGAGELLLVRRSFDAIPEAAGRADDPIDAVPHLDGEAIARLARRHLDALSSLDPSGRAARIVDKMPENALHLGLIAAMFPRTRLIHCRRDPKDIALSCWMTHFARVRWACDPVDIAGRIREHRRVMQHWRGVLPVPVLEIDYEAMVTDPEPQARRLLDWSDLDWDPSCLAFHEARRPVRTASVAQVRRPFYTSSIGRWRNYERPLASLFALIDAEESAADAARLTSRSS